MTIFSLAQAYRLLGIDAKTLRRWLAQAQLTPQAHPTDARLKGLTEANLRHLALTHHRHLAPLSPEGTASAPLTPPLPPPALPQDVLALLLALRELPTQVAALQQQLETLIQLLPPALVSAPAPALVQQPACTPVVPRAPQPPPKPTHVIARVESVGEGRYVLLCPQQGLLPFEPESPQWFAWLSSRSAFRFVGQHGHFTAHRESDRLPNAVWRAHRKVRNQTSNLRLAHTPELTIAVLEQAAAELQAHLA
jgi:hypothetical protein